MKIDFRIAMVVGFLVVSQLQGPQLQAQQLQAEETSPEPAPPAPASTATEAADHEALRTLRESLTEAVIRGDVEEQIKFAHPNLVTTWQNHQVTNGFDELRKLMSDMNAGETLVFQGYKVRPEADDNTIIYGEDTAIAVGRSVPHYNILGMEFDLENRWTATLVKEDGQWKLAAYHVSGNILDNPILTTAKNSLYWFCGISLLIGLAIGAIGMKFLSKRR